MRRRNPLKQQRIDDALRNNSWAPVRRDAFHPYERCLLEASEARLTYDEKGRAHAESMCSIHLEGNATSFLETCGVGTATVRPPQHAARRLPLRADDAAARAVVAALAPR